MPSSTFDKRMVKSCRDLFRHTLHTSTATSPASHDRSICLERRNSVTKFNLKEPFPVYDESDDELITIDVLPRKPRPLVERSASERILHKKLPRETRVLIEKPTSARILDQELPSPPTKSSKRPPAKPPRRPTTRSAPSEAVEDHAAKTASLGRSSGFPLKAKSEMNLFSSHIMKPPLFSQEHRHQTTEKKQPRVRQTRRNSITIYNIDGASPVTDDEDPEYERMLLRRYAQSCREERSLKPAPSSPNPSKTTSKSCRNYRSVDRTAKWDRNLVR
jgi:hypothetical protein